MKRTVIWLLVAVVLIAAGAALVYAVMAPLGWKASALDPVKYDTKTVQAGESFTRISITSLDEDIAFVPSADGRCEVTFYLPEYAQGTAAVKDGELTVKAEIASGWLSRFRFTSRTAKITVSLPAGAYERLAVSEKTGDIDIPKDLCFAEADIKASTGTVSLHAPVSGPLTVTTSTGDIRLTDISAGTVKLYTSTGDVRVHDVTAEGEIHITVNTGDVTLEKVRCGSLYTEGNTGELKMTDVLAAGKMTLNRSTGDVIFTRCDAETVSVRTSTGDVRGSLLSGKTFTAKSGTGDVHVPDTAGGACEITTSTGDIRVTVQ